MREFLGFLANRRCPRYIPGLATLSQFQDLACLRPALLDSNALADPSFARDVPDLHRVFGAVFFYVFNDAHSLLIGGQILAIVVLGVCRSQSRFAKSASASTPGQRAAVSFRASIPDAPHERIIAIKRGVPAAHILMLAKRMNIAKEALIGTRRLSRATVDRKARFNKPLSQDESERVLGVEYLIGQVENMVKESGNPEGFDAAKWVSNWLTAPLPARGGQTPASYMDTAEGQKLVSNLLATAQSGTYA
jgi:uncharacterized protein (DUF2384 family)